MSLSFADKKKRIKFWKQQDLRILYWLVLFLVCMYGCASQNVWLVLISGVGMVWIKQLDIKFNQTYTRTKMEQYTDAIRDDDCVQESMRCLTPCLPPEICRLVSLYYCHEAPLPREN